MAQELLKVENLSKSFLLSKNLLGKKEILKAVDQVSFSLDQGETLGIVGESGSGKSTLARCIMGLYPDVEGHIYFDGQDINALSPKNLHSLRPRMQMVFQDPYSSLNPRFTAGAIILESLRNLKKGKKEDQVEKVKETMEVCGLSPDFYQRYPYEFSGGQRQRISIARALVTEPDLVILDEPTSALDVSIQAQIIDLLKKLQKDLGLTYIFISHDLAVVANLCHQVAVMEKGHLVETGDLEDLFQNPKKDYTKRLLRAIPIDHPSKRKNSSICTKASQIWGVFFMKMI